MIREAEAEGLMYLKKADVSQEVLSLKSFEALQHVAEGQATKIIIPSDLQNIASISTTISEMMKK